MPRSRTEFVAVFLPGGICWDNMATVRPWSEVLDAIGRSPWRNTCIYRAGVQDSDIRTRVAIDQSRIRDVFY